MPKVRYPANPGIVIEVSDTELRNARRLNIPVVVVDEDEAPETKSVKALYKSQDNGNVVPVEPESPAETASPEASTEAKEATK